MGRLRVTILGCGSAAGVPSIGGDWGACDPSNPKNARTRCSALIEAWGPGAIDPTVILIDTAPELRQHVLSVGVRRLDGVLYSHDHADQTHGIDDLRGIAGAMRARVKIHMDQPTADTLKQRFSYAFEGFGAYPPVLEDMARIEPYRPFCVEGPGGAVEILPLDQDHGLGQRSLGFRIGDFAYCNDVWDLPPPTIERLYGLKLVILDALRHQPHPTHAHVAKALGWVETLRPEAAILTNLHISLDYEALSAQLPAHVRPAFDGLRCDLAWDSGNASHNTSYATDALTGVEP